VSVLTVSQCSVLLTTLEQFTAYQPTRFTDTQPLTYLPLSFLRDHLTNTTFSCCLTRPISSLITACYIRSHKGTQTELLAISLQEKNNLQAQ